MINFNLSRHKEDTLQGDWKFSLFKNFFYFIHALANKAMVMNYDTMGVMIGCSRLPPRPLPHATRMNRVASPAAPARAHTGYDRHTFKLSGPGRIGRDSARESSAFHRL